MQFHVYQSLTISSLVSRHKEAVSNHNMYIRTCDWWLLNKGLCHAALGNDVVDESH